MTTRQITPAHADEKIKQLKLMEPSFQADPYEVSPSGDPFFADSRNVKAVEHDIAEAHRPNAKYTRLESKEDIMAMINDL